MSHEPRPSDDLLLEVIAERLSPDFKRPHDPDDITREQLILELIRQVEFNAYNYGVMEVRQGIRQMLGYDIPEYGWPKVPDFKEDE